MDPCRSPAILAAWWDLEIFSANVQAASVFWGQSSHVAPSNTRSTSRSQAASCNLAVRDLAIVADKTCR